MPYVRRWVDVADESDLSDKERRVYEGLVKGDQIKDIAERMLLSPSTISTYRARVLKKLKCANNADLVRYSLKLELVAA